MVGSSQTWPELTWTVVHSATSANQSLAGKVGTAVAVCAAITFAVVAVLLIVPSDPAARDPVNIDCASDVAEVCEAVAFVETVRGRPFKTFPEIEFLEASQFESRLTTEWEHYEGSISEVDYQAWQVLGLIDVDAKPGEDFDDNSTAGLLGVYLTDSKQLWVRDRDLTLLVRSVLVHELVHAHDDQWFDLERLEQAMVDTDSVTAIAAALEGNAMRIEEMWRSTLTKSQQDSVIAQEFNSLSAAEIAELEAYPEALLEVEGWPYNEGLSFVEWVTEGGGEDAVDDMLRRPPLTTEQVLHPGAWETREPPKPAPTPELDYEAKGTGVLGELVVGVLLGSDAARGWGGDAFVLYENDGQRCVSLVLVADTDADLDEMAIAAQDWVDESELARSGSQREGDRVTLTGCLEVDL